MRPELAEPLQSNYHHSASLLNRDDSSPVFDRFPDLCQEIIECRLCGEDPSTFPWKSISRKAKYSWRSNLKAHRQYSSADNLHSTLNSDGPDFLEELGEYLKKNISVEIVIYSLDPIASITGAAAGKAFIEDVVEIWSFRCEALSTKHISALSPQASASYFSFMEDLRTFMCSYRILPHLDENGNPTEGPFKYRITPFQMNLNRADQFKKHAFSPVYSPLGKFTLTVATSVDTSSPPPLKPLTSSSSACLFGNNLSNQALLGIDLKGADSLSYPQHFGAYEEGSLNDQDESVDLKSDPSFLLHDGQFPKSTSRKRSSICHFVRKPVRPLSKSSCPFVINFTESMLSGRMSTHGSGVVDGFFLNIGSLCGKRTSPHISVPFSGRFFQYLDDDFVPYPYTGCADLNHCLSGLTHPGLYRVPLQGHIQLVILNPMKTVVKFFVVKYDFTDMPPQSKTFIRQKIVSEKSGSLLYACHMKFWCSKRKKLYLYDDIRLVFSHRSPDSIEECRVSTVEPDPRYTSTETLI
eukprot:Sdes_comp20831_c0_seq1m17424